MKEAKWNQWNCKDDNFKKYKQIKSIKIAGNYKKKPPEVSIMIITYKRANGLKNALDSALKQTYKKPYEIVVVDDSGYDEATDKLMKEYCDKYKNIIYYRNEKNIGQYGNWNRVVELCRSPWYCSLHDDDMMKETYLEEMTNIALKYGKKAGLIGCYIDEFDSNNFEINKKPINKFVKLFMTLRKKKPIFLTLKDNMKDIFPVASCLFINKAKALEIGGLNDEYFPSSDFAFAAKMNYYHDVIFYPSILCYRGVGENVSLKQKVCNDSIKCAYYQTYFIAKTLKYSEKKCIKKASIAAVIAEIGVKGYNDVDYGNIKSELNMNSKYNKKYNIFLINIYSKFSWGSMIFR